ncbi:MAG: alanine--tRNA ligase [Candidatus Nanoarchaeia archaeon]|nr:alanine--tRNA ligase [Candidatus Nanoarchaeia archaeon]MDD5358028.1 alanine--tRNA ligase [Candidatus Nanoarchaeia archaeon]MDD5588947.1 alanine--tRNA ligase [Candidatus Nanoarchaeia archaeon]
MINRKELIKKYLEFFKSKGHKEIPSASLIPENDPTVLFTTAGMHPLVPYLLGQKHPLGKRLCDVQKCIRTGDIDEVGDATHHTFFEMLGNWSLGDYFKKESIEFSFELLTKILKIPKEKLSVTCFAGDKNVPKDEEAAKIWKSLGIKNVKFLGREDNWWGPAGNTGPCGPDTEIFMNNVEIWNNVFMGYNKTKEGKYVPLKQKNVDTGMGVERTIAVLNNLDDNYLTDCFLPIIESIEDFSGKKYDKHKKAMRIIADHLKAAVFIIADGIVPSNTEQGYVLRRLIRRAIKYGNELKMKDFTSKIAEAVFDIYDDYPEMKKNKKAILEELEKEEKRFQLTLEKGIAQFQKFIADKKISGKECFLLYQSYGFPSELIEEECRQRKIKFDEKGFEEELKKHQELSRTSAQGRFKSGLADQSEKTTKLHTATHLLLSALRIVLDDENIMQKGSNITAERLRLDFNFPRKLTSEEIKKVEDLVNAQIQKSCEVRREEMSPGEAKKKGAIGVFDKKYGEKVSVYTVEDFSKEICAGPHVRNTCEIGHFNITKEEGSSAGVRRIKAVID